MKARSANAAKSLPGRYYASKVIFAQEAERIFACRWLYAGRKEGLPEKGSFFLRAVEGESILLLRDQQGAARAFYNLCRHRGTRLCQQSEGRFSHSIQCPYHAWTYDLQGSLTGAPNMKGVEGFEAEDYPLIPVALQEWEGFLFLSFAAHPQPLSQSYAAVWSKFKDWGLEKLQVAHRIEYRVEANWKLIFQNYSECYHCPTVHPLLNQLTPYRDSSNDLEEGPILGGPMALRGPGCSMTLDGRSCAPPLGTLSDRDQGLVFYYTFFPNLLLSLHPDYVLVHRLERLEPAATRVVCEWLFDPQAMSQPGFDPSPAIEFWDRTNRQDWQVCELSQLGVGSRAYSPGPYADLESILAALDREYLRAMG
ncbi:MAG: aromatic ring-hydroxylating dioxygenase subunit alpha [Acidobacteriota bacterium]